MIDRNQDPIAGPPGINVICHATGRFGLGVAARNTIRTLDEAGVPIAIIDVDTHDGRCGSDTTYQDRLSADAPFSVNLFHLNPPEIVHLLQQRPTWLDLAGKLNACVPFWELPRVPADWKTVMDSLDIVLAPTGFIRDAVHVGAPEVACIHYPQTVYVPAEHEPDKARWGLRPNVTAFLLTFDLTSDLDRKNPYAALDAFQQSEFDAESAQLVIKLGNADHSPRLRRQADELIGRTRADSRISIVEEHLTYHEMLSLIASCDVLLALHRAEGLGLHLMEAMALGKALVTTAWSGNMDFTTAQNACLVPYELVPVISPHRAYRARTIGPGQVWAEPDVGVASQYIERLARDPEWRAQLGENARKDINRLHHDPNRLAALQGLVDDAPNIVGTTEHADRAIRLAAFKHIPLRTRIRRTAGKTLRALGLRH